MTSVIAHRGASVAAVENTIDAFRTAVLMRADGIELDVRRTADDVLVVHHEARLSTGTAICEIAADELPAHIPRFTEALAACAGAWVNVEIKNDPREPDFDPDRAIAEPVVAAVRAMDDDQRWLISSFDLEMIDRVHRLAPTLPTAWLVIEISDEILKRAINGPHRAIHPWVGALTAEIVGRCQAAGLVVNTWTCNDPDRIRELVAWGVDGFCTDVPDLAREVLAG
jgi:glycerophosphoryl diester phosphodiesterase